MSSETPRHGAQRCKPQSLISINPLRALEENQSPLPPLSFQSLNHFHPIPIRVSNPCRRCQRAAIEDQHNFFDSHTVTSSSSISPIAGPTPYLSVSFSSMASLRSLAHLHPSLTPLQRLISPSLPRFLPYPHLLKLFNPNAPPPPPIS